MTPLSDEASPAQHGTFSQFEVGDELLIHNEEAEKIHRLNSTAAFVLQRCNGRATVAEITTMVEKEFAGASDSTAVRADVRAVLTQLSELGVVNILPPNTAL